MSMSSWAQSSAGRRPQHNPNGGGGKPLGAFRRPPYPPREERIKIHYESERYEDFEQINDYSGAADYETYEESPHQSHPTHPPSDAVASPAGEIERSALYQRLYEQFHGDGAKQPADCVVLSVNNQNLDYPKSLGHCLQERGLSVEMLYLQAESGLTRALQDVRSDGSPFCILVEQNNVTLSSCTVIIFSESLKIHRNMPKDQAMEFVKVEFGHLNGSQRQRDPAKAEAQAAELTENYLERAKLERCFVPSTTRHLLFLMAEGLHLYPEELSIIAEYIKNHQDHLQALPIEVNNEADQETLNSVPAGLGNPPPLVPNPTGPSQPRSESPNPPSGMEPPQGHLMGASVDSYLKTKPPPLLSIDVLQGSTHRLPAPQGPELSHGPCAHHTSPGPPHGPTVSPHGPPAPSYGFSAPLHGPSTPPPGPSDPYGPHVSRGPQAPRGPPGLRSLLSPRDAPVSRGSQGPHGLYGSADHGPHPSRGPPLLHEPRLSYGPSVLRGTPSQNGPGGSRGLPPPRGPRAPPPALRSLHLGNPTGPVPRPLRRLIP